MSKADRDMNEILKLQAAAMREALEAVEWVEREGHEFCLWCGNWEMDGHRPDCSRQLALAADAGRGLLERTEQERGDLVEAMTEIQVAHKQIDQWNFGIPTRDEIDSHELSLSERIADLCLRLERAERERGEAMAALRTVQRIHQATLGLHLHRR